MRQWSHRRLERQEVLASNWRVQVRVPVSVTGPLADGGAFIIFFFVGCWHIVQIRTRISLVIGFFSAARLIRQFPAVMALMLACAISGTPIKSLAFQNQEPPPQDISFSVNGTITEQSSGKLTVDSGQNMLFTVKYDSTTKIEQKDGSPAKASDLRVGVKILAKGALTEAGDVIAKTITIESGSKGPPK